jgi:hypothetical protein
MKRNKTFKAAFKDGSTQVLHARSLEHALGLLANRDLVMTFEELDERGNPKPGGIYQTFSAN